jgi:hypothetical protein
MSVLALLQVDLNLNLIDMYKIHHMQREIGEEYSPIVYAILRVGLVYRLIFKLLFILDTRGLQFYTLYGISKIIKF